MKKLRFKTVFAVTLGVVCIVSTTGVLSGIKEVQNIAYFLNAYLIGLVIGKKLTR